MKIIVVDDERLVLENLIEVLNEAVPLSTYIKGFNDPYDALEYMRDNIFDIAFLDIEMYEMSGIELAKRFKDICPMINIIFVTAYSDYAIDAFSLHASGYILKPASIEAVKRELCNLRNNSLENKKSYIRIQTFGYFEVFVNDVPLTFKRAKSKELLAFLVDRKGSGANIAELASAIWEDREYNKSLKNQIQTIISDMMKSLKSVNVEDIVIKKWNNISIDPSKFDCDYYNFLKGYSSAINSYTGEYMSNYRWAEFTTGFLDEKNRR